MTIWDDDAQDPFERRPGDEPRRSAEGRDAAATALVVVGVLGVVAWVWFAIRTQFQGSPYPGFGDAPEVSLAVRLDLLANSFSQLILSVAAIVAGRYILRRG